MNKTILLLLAPLLYACNNKNEENLTKQQETIDVSINSNIEETANASELKFNINSMPISTTDIGDFPFFSAPDGATFINNPKVLEFDFIVFATPENIYEVEGKTFRSHVHKDKNSTVEISGRYLNKSFEDAILNAGGTKVFDGKLTKEQKEKYKQLATYAGSNGSLDIWNDAIATYVIRKNEGNVYIAMTKATGNTTSIQIVQEKPFVQTIQKITSAKIENDLLNAGKSVLHINFDTDKATLKPDGLEAVKEIIAVLTQNPDMKISINGYTDATGNDENNRKLSENRALTVKNEMIKAGINKDRLTSKGFGSEKPLADNATEQGKAQNRRVELIKL